MTNMACCLVIDGEPHPECAELTEQPIDRLCDGTLDGTFDRTFDTVAQTPT